MLAHRRHGQQRQQRQDRNDRNILKQQHRKGGATALALHQLALLQALQHDGGGGERQNEANGQPLLQRQTDQVRHAGQSCRGKQHLQASGAEDRALQLPQEGRTQLKTDQKQHQHHAKLGEVHHILLLPHQPQQEGAYDDPRQQVAEHRAQPPALGQRHRDDGGGEVDKGIKQDPVAHQSALRVNI